MQIIAVDRCSRKILTYITNKFCHFASKLKEHYLRIKCSKNLKIETISLFVNKLINL